MPYKDKSIKTQKQNEYIEKKYDRVNLLLEKGKKEIIKQYTKDCGESVNAFINRAIDMLLEKEKRNS